MSHEFKIHHYVSELMTLFGVKNLRGPGAEVYANMLQKNIAPYVTTQVSTHNAKCKLSETTATPNEFLDKYDELKSKNVRDLDPLVYLMSKISEDKQIMKFLKRHSESRSSVRGGGGGGVGSRASGGGSGLEGPDGSSSVSSGLSQLPVSGSKITHDELERIKAQLMQVSSEATAAASSSSILQKISRDKQSKQVNIPEQPEWISSRRFLTMDFVTDTDMPTTGDPPIGSLPLHVQENCVIDDILFCAEGVEGKYIQALPVLNRFAAREFRVDSTLDPSLRDLTRRILPLCSSYSLVVRFIEEKSLFQFGLVNHALCAAMRTLVKDYMVLIAQLEYQHRTGQLTLQKLWFFLQPTMQMMDILVSVVNAINKGDCRGGSVLSLLHEKASSLIGNPKGQELCLYLIQSACVPYFEILEKWIYKGIIVDPYAEFLVKENEAYQKEKLQEDYNDAYWEQHYTICDDRIPTFLERIADKILNTGKYLNVVRQCGREVNCPHAQEIVYTVKERQYFEHIEKGYDYASKLLLQLLIEEKELMARLRSIKHYFLLDQGDFIVQFMDMAEDEMKKPMNEIMLPRLEALLELVLRTSTANEDPFKDDLKVVLLSYDLITQLFKILTIETKQEKDYKGDATDLRLSGLEAFSFDYIVKWPVSLVVSRKSLIKYQMLFRHLFYCKHVERRLCSVWLDNKMAKILSLRATRWYAAAFTLRQRMLNFVQNFEYYMTFEVIEPNWNTFESNMENVSNIDDVLRYHTDFLNVCLKDCMLTNPELLKILHKLMMVCITFSNFMQRQAASIEAKLTSNDSVLETSDSSAAAAAAAAVDESKSNKRVAKVMMAHISDVADTEDFQSSITNFDSNFTTLLVQLLDKIMEFSVTNCEHKLMNILYRLDFNNFYTKQLEELSSSHLLPRSVSGDDYSSLTWGGGSHRKLPHYGSTTTLGSGSSSKERSRIKSSTSHSARSVSVDCKTKR